jgi:beta-carotene 3-hydroxylase
VIPVLVVAVSFAGMEAVSYGTHRWVMHGPGMIWHRSHHLPPTDRFERNDLFPLCFAGLGFAAFAAAAVATALQPLRWVGLGMTLYGATYLLVHDVVIHRRVHVPIPDRGYIRWLRESHQLHHRYGGEPYGMLLPVVPRSLRARARAADRSTLDRSARAARTRL